MGSHLTTCLSAALSGAGRPPPHSRQTEEAVSGEDGRAGPRQPQSGESRDGSQEATTQGGGAEERAGTS